TPLQTFPLQTHRQARTAINPPIGLKEFMNPASQKPVLHRPLPLQTARPRVIPAPRGLQHLAQFADGIPLGHTLDQGIFVGSVSDNRPSAFFKISCCRLSFSCSLSSCLYFCSSSTSFIP